MIDHIGEITAFILFFIGIYGLIARRNIIKSIISIGIMETGVILFFISINYEPGGIPPIGPSASTDPLVQALMITAIVIGIAITAVGLTMFIKLYHQYGTTNWEKARKKRKEQ
jgi:multicomponent Na+:H+ antiporter subunit C